MTPNDINLALQIGGGAAALGGSLYGGWRWLSPKVSAVFQPARDGLAALASIPLLHTSVAELVREVKPNGGTSLKDSLNRVEVAVDGLTQRQLTMEATARVRADTDPLTCLFECSPDGQNTYVSESYARLMKTSRENLLHWGFLSFVDPDDRVAVGDEWDDCREKRRVYGKRHRMVSSDGETITVDVSARPVPEDGEVQKWVGMLRRVNPTL